MERSLLLRKSFFGPDAVEVWEACKTLADMCNLLAISYLQQGVCVRERLCSSRVLCSLSLPVSLSLSLYTSHGLSPPFQTTLGWCTNC